MRGKLAVGAMVIAMSLLRAVSAAANRPRLDPSFGKDGVVLCPDPRSCGPGPLAVAPNGTIYQVTHNGVAAHLSSGANDRAFRGGFVHVNPKGWPHLPSYVDEGATDSNVVVQPDGKVLVSGYHSEMWPIPRFSIAAFGFVARLGSNGKLDPTFGNEGAIWPTDLINNLPTLALLPAGNILISSVGGTAVVSELLPSGQPDLSFGKNGAVVPTCAGSAGPGIGCSYGLFGQTVVTASGDSFLVADRGGFLGTVIIGLLPSGAPNPGFAVNGTLVVDAHARNAISDVTLDQGKLLIRRAPNCLVQRITPHGKPDPTFTPTRVGSQCDPSFDPNPNGTGSMAVRTSGEIFIATPSGVVILNQRGRRIGRVKLPGTTSVAVAGNKLLVAGRQDGRGFIARYLLP